MISIRELIEELKRWDLDRLVSGDFVIYSGQPRRMHIAQTEARLDEVYASSSGSPK
jgi:hypothetical protein